MLEFRVSTEPNEFYSWIKGYVKPTSADGIDISRNGVKRWVPTAVGYPSDCNLGLRSAVMTGNPLVAAWGRRFLPRSTVGPEWDLIKPPGGSGYPRWRLIWHKMLIHLSPNEPQFKQISQL